MNALRRTVAFLVFLSFAGMQSASAACAMMTHADTGPHAEPAHSSSTHHEDGPTDAPDSNSTQACALMMACATAAPSVGSTMPVSTLNKDTWLTSPVAVHLSPSLAFEPPPPRAHLI